MTHENQISIFQTYTLHVHNIHYTNMLWMVLNWGLMAAWSLYTLGMPRKSVISSCEREGEGSSVQYMLAKDVYDTGSYVYTKIGNIILG